MMNETELRVSHWRNGSTQAERLASAILRLSGFEAVEPQASLGGADGRRDIVCVKGAQRWTGAVYFTAKPVRFPATRSKFQHDLGGVTAQFDGIAFITNQPLTLEQRKQLADLGRQAGKVVDVFHLERICQLLDSPLGIGSRAQFLQMPATPEEQISWMSANDQALVAALTANTREVQAIRALLEKRPRAHAERVDDLHAEAQAETGFGFNTGKPGPAEPRPGMDKVDDGSVSEEDDFLLYNPSSLANLNDASFFARAVSQFYANLAAAYGCSVSLSLRRLREAHDRWQVEQSLSLRFGESEDADDHFIEAGRITYALLRSAPINDIWFDEANGAPMAGPPSTPQISFSNVGSELCALFAGFYLCLAYEVVRRSRLIPRENVAVIREGIGVRELPHHFAAHYPGLLKRNPMSSAALYMIFRSLFDTLEWEAKPARPPH